MKISTRPEESLDAVNTKQASATEDAVTNMMAKYQPIFDSSADIPQWTPKEINALYPGLDTDAGRQALRRVGATENSERGRHLGKLIACVDRFRAGEAYVGGWDIVVSAFPGDSAAKVRRYFIDILILWCLPTNPTFAQEAVTVLSEGADSPLRAEFLAQYPNITQETIDEQASIAQKEVSNIYKKYANKYKSFTMSSLDDYITAVDSDALDDWNDLLSLLAQIEMVFEKDYYALWYELREGGFIADDNDRAEQIVALLRAFVRTKD